MININYVYSEIFLAISIMALLIIGVFKKNSSSPGGNEIWTYKKLVCFYIVFIIHTKKIIIVYKRSSELYS